MRGTPTFKLCAVGCKRVVEDADPYGGAGDRKGRPYENEGVGKPEFADDSKAAG